MVLVQAMRLPEGGEDGSRLRGVVAPQRERRDDLFLSRDMVQGACYVCFGLNEMT